MRARLQTMLRNEEFSFICGAKVADKIDRVIVLAGGEIRNKKKVGEDTVIRIMKGE